MFDQLLQRTRTEIANVRSVLRTNEALRSLLFGQADATTMPHRNFLANHLGQDVPDPTNWRIHDHSAGVTRLYAIYERCVTDVVKAWLTALPQLVPQYSDLEENVKNAHRRGTAKILDNVNRQRFKHLLDFAFVKSFHDAVSGTAPYDLLPESFLFKDANLRKETLEEILSSVAIENSWNWINGSRFTTAVMEALGIGTTTPESELRKFISYRNDAAHGAIDQVLGVSAMLELADFVEAVCLALCELATWSVLSHRVALGVSTVAGEVTERFDQANAVVAKMMATQVAVGDRFFVCGSNGCFDAAVTSIQLNNVNHATITVTDGAELGLQFNAHVPKNRKLLRW